MNRVSRPTFIAWSDTITNAIATSSAASRSASWNAGQDPAGQETLGLVVGLAPSGDELVGIDRLDRLVGDAGHRGEHPADDGEDPQERANALRVAHVRGAPQEHERPGGGERGDAIDDRRDEVEREALVDVDEAEGLLVDLRLRAGQRDDGGQQDENAGGGGDDHRAPADAGFVEEGFVGAHRAANASGRRVLRRFPHGRGAAGPNVDCPRCSDPLATTPPARPAGARWRPGDRSRVRSRRWPAVCTSWRGARDAAAR